MQIIWRRWLLGIWHRCLSWNAVAPLVVGSLLCHATVFRIGRKGVANPVRASAGAWCTRPLVGHPRGVALLGLPDDQILACRLHHLFGHGGQGVNFENPLDLRQEAMQ